MGTVSLDDILVTALKRIPTVGGDVMHALKKSDTGFNGFGEVYFSTVRQNAVKAWKLHQRMTLNLVLPVGEVLFSFFDAREQSETHNKACTTVLSQDSYFRLTVPPGIWFGFKGLSVGLNLICNVADITFDPDEVLRIGIDEIDADWSRA